VTILRRTFGRGVVGRGCAWLAVAATGCFVGQACDPPEGPENLAEQCGLRCPEEGEGIVAGNSSISGIVEVDAFFGAVIDLSSAASSVNAGIRADLDRLALSLNLDAGSSGSEIADALRTRIEFYTDGGLELVFGEVVCQASVEVSARAAAECDVDVDPGTVEVACSGSCQVESGVAVDCGADGTLECVGTAPGFTCNGTCSGSCQLAAPAPCEGVCKGTCGGTCSVVDGNGECAGACEGDCQGTCELEAGGDCTGSCEGVCAFDSPDGTCDASMEARCTADAGGTVDCEGRCQGTAKPPSVKAECEAVVQTKADASLNCLPPSLVMNWQWAPGVEGDANAEAEFRAWLVTLEQTTTSAKSKGIKGDILVDGFAAMQESGEMATRSAADAALSGDLKASIGAGCALPELTAAGTLLAQESTTLATTLSDLSQVLAEVSPAEQPLNVD
jgi:hypothetical protein